MKLILGKIEGLDDSADFTGGGIIYPKDSYNLPGLVDFSIGTSSTGLSGRNLSDFCFPTEIAVQGLILLFVTLYNLGSSATVDISYSLSVGYTDTSTYTEIASISKTLYGRTIDSGSYYKKTFSKVQSSQVKVPADNYIYFQYSISVDGASLDMVSRAGYEDTGVWLPVRFVV